MQSDHLPHNISRIQWNCTVPHWPDFQLHLRCNLLVECDNGQDEDGCGYVTCRHGGFLFRHTCYVIIQPEHDVTHHTARQMCRMVQGQLATFPSELERVAFGHFVYERHKLSFLVGIQATISGLPAMYALWLFVDCKVACVNIRTSIHLL